MLLALCMQRASYCSLINLNESSVSDCRGALSNSDFLLSSAMVSEALTLNLVRLKNLLSRFCGKSFFVELN